MDAERFDALSRSLTAARSRRGLPRLLGSLSLGLLAVLGLAPALAGTRLGGTRCTEDSQCLTKTCAGTERARRCTCTRKIPLCKQPSNPCREAICNVTRERCVTTNTTGSCPDDGNPCTRDVCRDGRCTHPPRTGSCPSDRNPCTKDICQDGKCRHPHKPDGVSCGSGKVCDQGTCCTRTCGDDGCGDDGCGGSCGACGGGTCDAGTCTCPSGAKPCEGNCVGPCDNGTAFDPVGCACCVRNRDHTPKLCSDNGECCSGRCEELDLGGDRVCFGRGKGAACDFNEQCEHELCTDGVCRCPSGRPPCGNGQCANECTEFQFLPPGSCRCCIRNGASGGSCAGNPEGCCAGVDACDPTTFKCVGRPLCEPCAFDAQCIDGAQCQGGRCVAVGDFTICPD